MAPRMIDEVRKRAERDCDGACADGDMRRFHADHIDKQRYCENRPATPDQAENETDQGAGEDDHKIGSTNVHAPTLPLGAQGVPPAFFGRLARTPAISIRAGGPSESPA